jgi:hypothetical protein
VSLLASLTAELQRLGERGETIGYGELARRLAVPGPGSVATLTRALEDLMAEDARAGRSFLASVCTAKLGNGLPARGFFEAAARLGRFSGSCDGPEASAFIAAERAALLVR